MGFPRCSWNGDIGQNFIKSAFALFSINQSVNNCLKNDGQPLKTPKIHIGEWKIVEKCPKSIDFRENSDIERLTVCSQRERKRNWWLLFWQRRNCVFSVGKSQEPFGRSFDRFSKALFLKFENEYQKSFLRFLAINDQNLNIFFAWKQNVSVLA